ncbi:signal peptidase-like protein I [Halenospora varia]|nr:signal peptidase-like protein I [Halenospora varia]
MPPFRFPVFLKPPLQFLKKHYYSHPFLLFTTTLKTLLLFHVITRYQYSIDGTWGASMLPTFSVFGDHVLIDRGYRRGRGVEVGDVVTFDSVVEPGEKVIKRVLGLEGDYVMRNTPGSGSQEMIQIPKGHCWVVGDNLGFSRDSRHFGPMPMALIKGKVIAKVFPWKEREWLTSGLNPVV